MGEMIYLDNAATTFPKSNRVYETMDFYLRNKCVNAGRGGYKLAREATQLIDDTKRSLLSLLKLPQQRQVIFTPSATIALNQIIFGLEWDKFKNIYVTPFEHNAIMRPLHKIAKQYGATIHIIPFHKDTWELDVTQLEKDFVINNPDYIFMSHMSNVTGYILPCELIMKLAQKYEPVSVVDCSQSLGTIPIHEKVLEANVLVFAGHKSLYGPLGIGGFISDGRVLLQPVIVGGTGSDSLNLEMPESGSGRYEAASYNIQAIAGLNEAIEWIKEEGVHTIYDQKRKTTSYLISELNKLPQIKIYLPADLEHHSSIVSINIQGWTPSDLGVVLDEDFSIAVRTGYHCSPLIHEFLSTKETLGTVRISLGYFNTNHDVNELIMALKEILEG